MKTNKNVNHNNKNATAIIIFLSTLFLISLILGYNIAVSNGVFYSGSSYLEIPTINTSINSTKDDKPHMLKMDVSLDLNKKAGKIDPDNMYNEIKSIVSELDFSKINSTEGFDYLKENVKKNIKISPEHINGIYISKLQTDLAITKEKSKYKSEGQEKVFRALFPSMK